MIEMDALAECIYGAILTRYQDFAEATIFEGDAWETELDTDEVVATIASGALDDQVSERVLGDIIEAIATESWFEDDARGHFSYSWEQFSKTVRHEARFVLVAKPRPGGENEPPARLARFLEGLLGYADKSTRMLHLLPVGTSVFRGRMTDDLVALRTKTRNEPAKELGAAPPDRAAPGRMSGEGVPLFYAADNVHTAVAEISIHSPYDLAIVGEFITQRPLTILDFTRSLRMPSIFDPAEQYRRMFVEFVDDFVESITTPVILDGRERVEYLPTQLVTEYLRWVPERRIDGIAFPSRTDNRGKNFVLFTEPWDDVVTDPPTQDERRSMALSRNLGDDHKPMLTISPRAISEHSVSRSVRLKSLGGWGG
jgi:RES domain-containing protein